MYSCTVDVAKPSFFNHFFTLKYHTNPCPSCFFTAFCTLTCKVNEKGSQHMLFVPEPFILDVLYFQRIEILLIKCERKSKLDDIYSEYVIKC